MWKPCLLCASGLVGLALAAALLGGWRAALLEDGFEWAASLGSGEPDAVLVLLVADRPGVAAVRAAVDPARILAATPDAIVLREGRVVATGPEAVGEPLVAAGFADRSIELWAIGPRGTRGTEGDQPLSLTALAAKPTLTPLEVLAILNGSAGGI